MVLDKRFCIDYGPYVTSIIVQVVRAFSWCEIVGKRFPICHVHMDNSIVEVCPLVMLLAIL